MIIKCIEIRDRSTCIPALAIKMDAASAVQDRFLWRSGYPRNGSAVVLMRLSDQRATVDPYEWPSLGPYARTMPSVHNYIIEHFGELLDGQVVDTRVVLGETATPAKPEIWRGA